MGISITGGVRVPQGKFSVGLAAAPAPSGFRYWRLEVTTADNNGTAISELKMTFDDSSNFLDSFTLTNIGGAFNESFPLININDTIAETSNAANIGFVPVAGGNMDFYVDFGVGNEKDVSVYSVAPQGLVGFSANNVLIGFNAHKSNNAVDWTLVKSFSGITETFPDWNPGTYRDFDLTT